MNYTQNATLRTSSSNITQKQSKTKKQLLPNAAKMVESLRDMGYNPVVAIQDIVDNAIDADATEINVKIESGTSHDEFNSKGKPKKYTKRIIISDNGHGMDYETLCEAIRYGSNSDHDHAVDLGKYGMGLNTAGTSMGRNIIVLTRTSEGKLYRGECDLDNMVLANDWIYEVTQVSDDTDSGTDSGIFDFASLNEFYKHSISGTGTVVMISKLDRVSQDPKSLANSLKSEQQLPRTYRHLLSSGKLKLSVNKTNINPFDPLYWCHPDTKLWTDGWVPVNGYSSLQYRIANVRDVPEMTGKRRLTTTQGICWIRNEREIGVNKTEPFWRKFPDHRGFLIEIKFSGDELDQHVGVNIQKQLTNNLNQSFVDILSREIMPWHKENLNFYKDRERDKKKASIEEGLENIFENYGEQVKMISKSLHLPAKAPKTITTPSGKKTQSSQKGTPSIKQVRTSHVGRNFIFSSANWTRTGPMYQASLGEKDEIYVSINEDHPAMAGGLFGGEVEPQRLLFMHLISALALSELQLPEDFQDAYDKFKDIASSNARELFEKINKV